MTALALAAPVWADVVVYPDDPLVVPQNGIRSEGGEIFDNALVPPIVCAGTPPICRSDSLTGNTVTMNSGAFDWVFGAVNFQAGVAAFPDSNEVFMNGGTVARLVSAGHESLRFDDAEVRNNSVTVSGGTVNDTRGVRSGIATNFKDSFGNASGNTTAIGNSATVTGGTMHELYGGESQCEATGCIAIGQSNVVDIRGGTVGGTITGLPSGVVAGAIVNAFAGSGIAQATDNIVKISGNPNISGAQLWGGYALGGAGSASTGNDLQVLNTSGLSAVEVRFFQQLSFTLPAGLTPADTVLALSNTAYLGTDIVVTVVDAAPGMSVAQGDIYTLIDGANPIQGSVAVPSQTGTLAGYEYTLGIDPNDNTKLILTIGAPVVNPTGGTVGAAAVPALHPVTLALLALVMAAWRKGRAGRVFGF
jgi:hypothetical protein